MRFWLRLLVCLACALFLALSLALLAGGDTRAAAGAAVVALLALPLSVEAIRPGKYHLRKPDGGAPDNIINRVRQFRVDHPGIDGTLLLAVAALVGLALMASAVARFV